MVQRYWRSLQGLPSPEPHAPHARKWRIIGSIETGMRRPIVLAPTGRSNVTALGCGLSSICSFGSFVSTCPHEPCICCCSSHAARTFFEQGCVSVPRCLHPKDHLKASHGRFSGLGAGTFGLGDAPDCSSLERSSSRPIGRRADSVTIEPDESRAAFASSTSM